MPPKKPLPFLTKAEAEIMHVLWNIGRGLVRDILDQLDAPDVPHSTVSSVVRILEKKGFVDHKAYGKTHEYFPLITREEYAAQDVKGVLEKYFGSSPKTLVSFLVEKENLDLKELNDLLKQLSKK